MAIGSRIVVATDFSSAAASAFAPARELAEATGGEIHLVHVWDESVPVPSEDGAHLASLDEAKPTLETRLRDTAREHFGKVTVHVDIIRGDAVDEAIVGYAQTAEADLIVIATEGATGFKRFILGSVAEKVVRGATCPVLTVRRHDAESAE